MRLVILGDIGSSVDFHAGDEAMAEAFVAEMAARGDLVVTAISGCVDDTRARYGWHAVPRFGFGSLVESRAACEERLLALESAARGVTDSLAWDDPAWAAIDAVAGSDAVAITGGGNLSSTWPEHIYERAALAVLAGVFDKPFVVSGQTLGPHLLGRDGEVIAQLLHAARFVGVREEASLELLGRLGAPSERSVLTIDDATYLAGSVPEWTAPQRPYIAATFAPYAGILGQEIYHDLIVEVLAHAIELTDCDVVLIPHQGGVVDGIPSNDLAFHAKIADAVAGDRVHQAPMLTAAEVAELTRGATLVISSRYHPVVFGLSGSVPSVGIGVDSYTSTKIKGAMANFGMSSFHVNPGAFAHGDAADAVSQAWSCREQLTEFLDAANAVRTDDAATWWDGVYAALSTGSSSTPRSLSDLVSLDSHATGLQNGALDRWSAQLGSRLATQSLGHSEIEHALATTEARVASLELALAATQASLNDAQSECVLLQDSAAAAQKLAGDLLERAVRDVNEASATTPVDDEVARLAQRLADSERELRSMRETRLFRYSRAPRAVYSRLRNA